MNDFISFQKREKKTPTLKFQETISGLDKFWLLFPFFLLVQLFLDVG